MSLAVRTIMLLLCHHHAVVAVIVVGVANIRFVVLIIVDFIIDVVAVVDSLK